LVVAVENRVDGLVHLDSKNCWFLIISLDLFTWSFLTVLFHHNFTNHCSVFRPCKQTDALFSKIFEECHPLAVKLSPWEKLVICRSVGAISEGV
jgi:hypothetical protein